MARVLAMMMVAPVVSRAEIPSIVKIGFAATISLSLYFQVSDSSINIIPTNPWLLSIAIFIEFFIGAIVGFSANLFFDGLQTIAQAVGVQMGQGSANIFDPATRSTSNPIAIFYLFSALTAFLMFNGLGDLFLMIQKTFIIAPIASFNVNLGALATNSIPLVNSAFLIALKFLLPVFVVMALTDLFVALVAKIMPQSNMYFLLMPNKLILGMIIIMLTFPGYLSNIAKFIEIPQKEYFLSLFS